MASSHSKQRKQRKLRKRLWSLVVSHVRALLPVAVVTTQALQRPSAVGAHRARTRKGETPGLVGLDRRRVLLAVAACGEENLLRFGSRLSALGPEQARHSEWLWWTMAWHSGQFLLRTLRSLAVAPETFCKRAASARCLGPEHGLSRARARLSR